MTTDQLKIAAEGRHKLMTLKEWKARLQSGQQLRCVYRWYWENGSKPAPEGGQLCTILHTKATQLIYSTADCPKAWMRFPKASELKADEKGFELYFPVDPKRSELSGKLMSRYEYVAVPNAVE